MMKKLIYLVIALVLITTTACKEDSIDILSGTGEIKASINGAPFETEVTTAFLADSTLQIGLFNSDPGSVQLHKIHKEGNFTLNEGSGFTEVISLTTSDGVQIVVSQGTYSITKLNNSQVEGTFQGTAYDVLDLTLANPFTVTNGSFKANL